VADDKVERLKTGGGTFVPQVSTIDEKLLAVLGNRARPLVNSFDSDAFYHTDSGTYAHNRIMMKKLLLYADCFISLEMCRCPWNEHTSLYI
jgi:hypothetical protein